MERAVSVGAVQKEIIKSTIIFSLFEQIGESVLSFRQFTVCMNISQKKVDYVRNFVIL